MLSIIVPIYKVEKYLDRCIKSLVSQTYRNLEIILVDDGSPDGCPQICDEWKQRDSRIKVIHKPNGGLSDARNAGLRIATGDYIGFVDSDDYISADFYETLLSVALEHNSDIVECGVARFWNSGELEENADDLSVADYATPDALSALISENPFHQHVWNKLYKAEVTKGIDFEVGKLNEDEFWTYQVFGRAKRVSKINKAMYYYFQRSGSIMGEGYSLRRLDGLEGRWRRHLYIEEHYPSLALQSRLDFFGSCMFSYQCVLRYLDGRERRKGLAVIRNYAKSCGITFSEIKTIKGSVKKYFFLAKINMHFCSVLRNILRVGD